MIGDRNPAKAARRLACTLGAGLLAGAVCAVAAEGWDLNRDGAFTAHEAVLVPVRLLAFPVHALLQLTPAPVLQLLGVPEAPWPSSAAVAVALSPPLWGLLVCGVLVVEAWLEMAWAAKGHGRQARLAERRRACGRRWQAGRRADGGGSVHLHVAAASHRHGAGTGSA